mmetsp:Transcript_27418/g.55191  ORF Transcript_27418/g.55191 Transcript_27418/m.55191 type:complete len:209 (-) Transcript_27418:670-1296(-)
MVLIDLTLLLFCIGHGMPHRMCEPSWVHDERAIGHAMTTRAHTNDSPNCGVHAFLAGSRFEACLLHSVAFTRRGARWSSSVVGELTTRPSCPTTRRRHYSMASSAVKAGAAAQATSGLLQRLVEGSCEHAHSHAHTAKPHISSMVVRNSCAEWAATAPNISTCRASPAACAAHACCTFIARAPIPSVNCLSVSSPGAHVWKSVWAKWR